MPFVNWKRVTLPKFCGDLGIRDFDLLNQAFLDKLAWSFISNSNHLWIQVLRKKYIRFPLNGQQSIIKNFSITWKTLRTNNILTTSIKWNIGNGHKINFWCDSWLHFGPLRKKI